MAAPSRRTIGRYELLFELGRGGMAVLHLARAEGAGGFSKLFAVKQILPHLAADPPFVDMFLNEGRIAARLSHPNLCTVFELGQDGGELFLVMEYLDGVPWEALAAAMPRDARGLRLTAGVLAQACDGLHCAHTFRDVDGTAAPIVHRDVSPQNVFVSADGVCRVLDFGVSKIASDHRRTRTGLLKGKLPYIAPEQLRGEPADGRADVWAVGVMLWEALTGGRLFERDTDFLIYEAITGAAIPSINALGNALGNAPGNALGNALGNAPGYAGAPRYPAAVDRVIARALERDREARYATARELGQDLARVAGEIGGAASRDQIAAEVGALCGDQLAARRRAIAGALASRAGRAPGAPGSAGHEPGTGPARTTTGGDAAATISMAMRKGSIIVERPRRRRWSAGLALLAVLAGGVAILAATRGDPAPAPAAPPTGPASPAPGGSALAAGAPASGAVASATPNATAPASGTSDRTSGRTSGGTSGIARAPADAASTPRPGSSAHHLAPRGRDAQVAAASVDPTRAAAAAGSGWYAIDSTPYATVFIDDRKIGDTPLDRIALPTGAHRVRAVLADGRQRTFSIDIAPDRKTSSGTLTW